MNQKILNLFNRYRALLDKRSKESPKLGRKSLRRGNRSKNKILDFYILNGRWPKRSCSGAYERRLAQKFFNFISKESGSYDLQLRRIALATGHKSNHKSKHDVVEFKKKIISFVEENGRVPSPCYACEQIEGEANLRRKLDYYTKNKNDMTLLGRIFEVDKCHLSGIPMKYRAIINKSLDVERPLVRLPKRELGT